jgi:cell division protein FtsA
MENKKLLVAIDIGTSKIYTIIAEVNDDNRSFKVIGTGVSPSRGLKKGMVVDVEEVTRDVEVSVQAAEHMADVSIEGAFIGVAGRHIESLMSHATVVVGKTPREITQADRQSLGEVAVSKVVPVDRKVIHKIVYNYRIDDSGVVKNPIGMSGVKLEADVHIVTGQLNAIDALVNSVNKLSIEVEDVVLQPLASAKAVLSDTEKQLGSILVDMGGGTTDIAVYKNDKLIYTSVIPIGGKHFTNDIAALLGIDLKTADRLKKQLADYISEGDIEEQIIEIPSHNYEEVKEVEISYLKKIVEARIYDVIDQVKKKIEASGFKHYISTGIVFTGGGSKVAGLKEIAQESFDIPVRLGRPLKLEGLMEEMNRPEDATGVGLLLYGIERYFSGEFVSFNKKLNQADGSVIKVLKEKIKEWVDSLF